ncbi:hypothetical protein [Microtetraspora sp. NBRC 16547]|uniref:hypothetical protein n=1 Tax=Microtetraspora sp. NBRC 16547 TaxID=3030993 RepID=UPI0024A33038|nr:hypothetical protein [Microtetraspora sp. NBRC 16547]GLX02274.1 hypothetical protein Misp02_63600 [Microtetraspora sp. NBRC 16547]
MAALLVPDHQAISLTRALDDVVADAADAYGVTPSAELHGTDLLHGNRDWEPLKKMPRARIGVYHAAFQAIGGHEVAVILRGVCTDLLRQRYATPYAPHQDVREAGRPTYLHRDLALPGHRHRPPPHPEHFTDSSVTKYRLTRRFVRKSS